VTINQPTDTAATPPGTGTGRAGPPRRRLIILASVMLVLPAGVIAFVATALTPPAAPTAHGTARPLTGRGTGTTTLSLLTGVASSEFTGHLSPLGAESGYDNLRFTLTGASTFTYTGTRTFGAASGGKLFSAITGTRTFTRTTAKSTETDTITGGTGRFAGASGTYRTQSDRWSCRPPRPARQPALRPSPTGRSATRPDRSWQGLNPAERNVHNWTICFQPRSLTHSYKDPKYSAFGGRLAARATGGIWLLSVVAMAPSSWLPGCAW
jgi:hypothetical protein